MISCWIGFSYSVLYGVLTVLSAGQVRDDNALTCTMTLSEPTITSTVVLEIVVGE